jgi:hypothetical protein
MYKTLKKMVSGFIKSPEGVKEFEKLGLPYPSEFMEDYYENEYFKDTKADVELVSKYGNGHLPIEVLRITRKRLKDGREYIYYSATEYRVDKALNLKHWFKSGLGRYPIVQGRYEMVHKDFGESERVLRDILSIDTGYSIPFSKENLDKIRDLGLNPEGKTTYSVEAPNGIRLSVAAYDDLRNGDFDELVHFNKIPTPGQRKLWLESQGIEQDQKRIDQLKINKDVGEVPEQPITASDVKKIIKEVVEEAANPAADKRKKTINKENLI